MFLSELIVEQTRNFSESVSPSVTTKILQDGTKKSQNHLLAAVDLGYLEVSRELIQQAIIANALVFVRGLAERGHAIPEEYLSDGCGHADMFHWLINYFYPGKDTTQVA
jgi:hypothetical protein